MVDAESIEIRLRRMGSKVAFLREVAAHGRDRFMSDEMAQAATERALQIAIQAALDVANHILAEDSDITPGDYGAAFAGLGSLGIIDEELASRLRAAAGLRNVLVHMYLEVDVAKVWDAIEHVDDLETFGAAIGSYLARSD